MKVELSQEEVQEALVLFAARKAKLSGTCRHKVQIMGVWTTLGDGPAVIVDIEQVTMVEGGRA